MYLQSLRNRPTAEKFPLFASLNFNLFESTLSALLKWVPRETLKRPLLNLRPTLIERAMRANKLIVGYMDKSTDEGGNETHCEECEICEADISQVSNLVRLGCQGADDYGIEIRDEIYCQLVKQTTGNADRRSCFRGYQLILCCLACFPPSEALAPFLLSHLYSGCQGGAMLSRRTVKVAECCLRALEMVQQSGSRKWGLSRNEVISLIYEKFDLTVKVWLTKEYAIDIDVDSWTTVKELKLAACEIVGIYDCSILTIKSLSSSADNPTKEDLSENLASSRQLLSSLFDQLYHHHLILASERCDGIRKGGFQSLFGDTTRYVDSSIIAEKTHLALDNNLQIKITTACDGINNESDNCIFVDHVESAANMRKPAVKPFVFIKSGLRELRKSFTTPTHFVGVNLKLCLIVWVFPYRGGAENILSSNHEKFGQLGRLDEECDVSEEITNYDDVENEEDDRHIADFFEPLNLVDINTMQKNEESSYWPHEEASRNILFAQLIDSIADGSLECVDNIDTLRLAALMIAEQHQQENRPLQQGLPSIALMQETVSAQLVNVLPSHLRDMPPSRRATAGDLIKKKLREILHRAHDGNSPLEATSGFGFGSFPNIMGLDCLERTARARNRSKYRIRTHYSDGLTTVSNVSSESKENIQELNWSILSIWQEFLSSVIVRLWLIHIDTLTARECRDEFLKTSSHCRGYGVVKYYPSSARISILTREVDEEYTPSRGLPGVGKYEEGEAGTRWYSYSDATVAAPQWVANETSYVCNTSSIHREGYSKVKTMAILFSLNSEEISLSEYTSAEDEERAVDAEDSRTRSRSAEEEKGDSKVEDSINSEMNHRLLLRIALDDIISWGYNDSELIIKFKRREGNHEESYYSDDGDMDEDENQDRQNEALDRIKNEWRRGKRYQQNSNSSVSEIASSASMATTASGCPVQANYHRQRYLEKKEMDVSRNEHFIEEGFEEVVAAERESEWAEKPSGIDGDQGIEHIQNNWHHSADSKVMSSDVSVSHSETKDFHPDCGSFVTDASSIVNEARMTTAATKKTADRRRLNRLKSLERREMRKQIAKDDIEQFEKQQIESVWNDSIYLEIQYGMEIAELLQMYSLSRDRAKKNDC